MALRGYVVHLESVTESNVDFRRVLYTGKYSQLVLMNLKPGEEIGTEVHGHLDQFFRFESGDGLVSIDGVTHKICSGDGVVIPAGASHNVVNSSKTNDLKFYTIYSPPEHIDKTIRRTKAEAIASPEEYNGKTTE